MPATNMLKFTAAFSAAEGAWDKVGRRLNRLRMADDELHQARYYFIEASRKANHWKRFSDEARANKLVFGADEAVIAGYMAEFHAKGVDTARQRYEVAHFNALEAYRAVNRDIETDISNHQAAMAASDDHPDSPPFRAMVAREAALSQEYNNIAAQLEALEASLRLTFQMAAF